jgi:hypothetical protein
VGDRVRGIRDEVLASTQLDPLDGPRDHDNRKSRSDLFNHMVGTAPATVLDILTQRGLADELLTRLAEIRRLYPRSKRWEKRQL